MNVARTAQRVLKKLFPISAVARRDVCVSLGQLFDSGMSAGESVRMVAANARPRLQTDLYAVARALDNQSTLSGALRRTESFSADQAGVIGAFEQIGEVGAGFRALAAALDDQIEMRRQLLKGLTYPSLLILAHVIISPLPRAMIASSGAYGREVMRGLFWVVTLGALLWFGVPALLTHWRARELAWKLPWPASIYRSHVRAVFCRTLARNLEAGIGLVQSLRSAAAATGDDTAVMRLKNAESAIQRSGLSAQLTRTQLVAKEDAMLVVSGEKSGNLVEGLRTVGQRYTEQRQAGQKALNIALGTGTTLVVMAMVGLSIVSAYQRIQGTASGLMDQMDDAGPALEMLKGSGVGGGDLLEDLMKQVDPINNVRELNAPRGG